MSHCINITNTSILKITQKCHNLEVFTYVGCELITVESTSLLPEGCESRDYESEHGEEEDNENEEDAADDSDEDFGY